MIEPWINLTDLEIRKMLNDPKVDEEVANQYIREAAESIQQEWSAADEQRRRVLHEQAVEILNVRLSQKRRGAYNILDKFLPKIL